MEQRDAESFHCAACEEDSIRWFFEPFRIQNYEYCIGCIEKQFSPIAGGDERNGLPKIGDEVLHARDDVMRLIDPTLRADFEKCLAMLREVAPMYRVYCPWPVVDGGGNCNKLLGRRADVSEDQSHQ